MFIWEYMGCSNMFHKRSRRFHPKPVVTNLGRPLSNSRQVPMSGHRPSNALGIDPGSSFKQAHHDGESMFFKQNWEYQISSVEYILFVGSKFARFQCNISYIAGCTATNRTENLRGTDKTRNCISMYFMRMSTYILSHSYTYIYRAWYIAKFDANKEEVPAYSIL